MVLGGLVGRRFGRLIRLCLMIEMFQVGILIMMLIITGRFWPMALIPGVGVLPGIGLYSGVSAGGLVPPLVFVLVAMMVPKRSNGRRALS
jgi:hypothetical protein